MDLFLIFRPLLLTKRERKGKERERRGERKRGEKGGRGPSVS